MCASHCLLQGTQARLGQGKAEHQCLRNPIDLGLNAYGQLHRSCVHQKWVKTDNFRLFAHAPYPSR